MIPSRILIISPNWIGDAIMAQPLLQILKGRYPDVQIDVLAPAWAAPVWLAMPEVNQVHESDFRHGKLQLKERWAMAGFLKTLAYDQAYVLPNTLKFALIPWLAKIPQRIGYLGETRYGLLNVIHHDDKRYPRPMMAFYAALADKPSQDITGRFESLHPRLHVDAKSIGKVKDALGLEKDKRIIAFAPGAEFGSAKRWPVSHFSILAELIIQRYPETQIVLLGSSRDREVCEAIHTNVPATVNLAGKTSLADAIALIAGVDIMVTNDSGLMHVASAFDLPVVALYGSTDYRHTPPFSRQSYIMSLDLECAPCQKRECPLGHHKCMEDLLPQMIFNTVEKIIEKKDKLL